MNQEAPAMNEPLFWTGRLTDLAGGLQVQRLLPSAVRRAVGPFVFFDHFGPVMLAPDIDSDVGGHPHIGLATVTYLFEGRQVHRDSLGTVQLIEPGAVNWMTAGRGIVHSERMHPEDRGRARPAHGLQLWVALPPEQAGCAPAFQHVPAAEVPEIELPGGAQARLLVGQAWGHRSPVRTASPTLYLDLHLPPLAHLHLPVLAPELALYSPHSDITLNGQPVPARAMAACPAEHALELQAGAQGARLVLIGGEPLPQPVRMWWNFVAADRPTLAEAARRWAEGGFDPIPGETERLAAPPWREG
jgi:redox-sensitive bicupin YhaK (pirin superfamily)